VQALCGAAKMNFNAVNATKRKKARECVKNIMLLSGFEPT